MNDYWVRSSNEIALRQGRLRRYGADTYTREQRRGRIVDSAVFSLEPVPWSRRSPATPARLFVQVRTGVSLLSRYRDRTGRLREGVQDDQIAIAGWGGRQDHSYTWVQAYADAPERLLFADGTQRTEDVAYDQEGPVVHGTDYDWHGRRWYVDVGDRSSARYAVRGTDLSVGDNGEIIYDSPTATLTMIPYLEDHPSVLRVDKTTEFQSYLLEVPVRTERTVYLPRQRTVAAVSWRRNQSFGRDRPGSSPRLLEQEYVVHFIVPNAVLPAGLSSVMWRAFRGH